MGNIDLDVVKSASSWAEGVKRYEEQKRKPLMAITTKPELVTTFAKSREDAAINPILQKFVDPTFEDRLRTFEQKSRFVELNQAWDKQLLREQHFDVINQIPKRGHIHEVPYVQKLKPPSLITATRTGGYDLLSTLGHDQHHWAPPDKRPPRIVTPPKKEMVLTEVNKPREFDIISNRFHENHDSHTAWEAEHGRDTTVRKFWEARDFNPISCTYYDTEKESFYNKRMKELLLLQGSDAVNKLPPTLARSESLMYNICTGVVKDPVRLEQKIEKERSALEARASRIKAEEMMRVRGDVRNLRNMERKDARVSHVRYTGIINRGFDIVSNRDFDKYGEPPPPKTKPKMSLWEFRDVVRNSEPEQRQTRSSGQALPGGSILSSAAGATVMAAESKEGNQQQPASLSKARIRTGGFQ